MNAPLAILLRNGTHAAATNRLALKAEQLAITYVRSPIQIPQVQGNPTIFDLGQVRPALTVSGLVDNIGTSLDQTAANYGYNMEALTISGQTYYVPYKNYLESKLVTWLTDDGYEVQLEIGDATRPEYLVTQLAEALDNSETGVDVDSTDGFLVGQVLLIESEQMTITAISDNTFTVARGANSTSAVTHVDNTAVSLDGPATGGGIYLVAVQQVQFTQTPGTEDRWMYSISFVAKLRNGITF
jgi:hypothetical protein